MMKRLNLMGSIMALLMMAAVNVAVADTATWADTVQKAITSLDLSDAQKMDIGKAFDVADAGYEKAISDARKGIAETLTDEQKTELADMANAHRWV